jgi:glycoside/pentoside/hexuronide:cation symporter, GPH family
MEATPADGPASKPAQSESAAPRDRVPVSQKIGYGVGIWIDMWGHWHYPNFAGLVFNIFLGVNPILVGIAVVLNRVFDAVSDPLFGWLSDNTRTRWGRRRPYMLVGAVLAGLGLPSWWRSGRAGGTRTYSAIMSRITSGSCWRPRRFTSRW